MCQNQLCLTLTKRLVTGVFAVLFLPRHLDKGGGGGGTPKKLFFGPFGTQFALKIRGVGPAPSPGSVTACEGYLHPIPENFSCRHEKLSGIV